MQSTMQDFPLTVRVILEHGASVHPGSPASGGAASAQAGMGTVDLKVIAAPWSEDSRTRRRELPMVMPNPRSSGSHTNFP